MKKVFIEPGCITCGLCEFIAPEVFEVTDISRVKTTADLEKNSGYIKQAAAGCPVAVIKYNESEKGSDPHDISQSRTTDL